MLQEAEGSFIFSLRKENGTIVVGVLLDVGATNQFEEVAGILEDFKLKFHSDARVIIFVKEVFMNAIPWN